MARLSGTLGSISKLKGGGYRVWLSLDNDGIEEESYRDYDDLKSLPRFLISIEGGKVKYYRGVAVSVALAFQDANGITWMPGSERPEK